MTLTVIELDIHRLDGIWLSPEFCTYKTVVDSLNFDSTFIAIGTAIDVLFEIQHSFEKLEICSQQSQVITS